MQKINVKVKLLHPDAKIPTYGSLEAAGFDLYAIKEEVLEPGKVTIVPTGVCLEVPQGYCYPFWDRSGLAAKGIQHFGGLIDSDYRGELKVIFFNSTSEPYNIKKGDRIMQGVFLPVVQAKFEEADELSETGRGVGGFHSTGE